MMRKLIKFATITCAPQAAAYDLKITRLGKMCVTRQTQQVRQLHRAQLARSRSASSRSQFFFTCRKRRKGTLLRPPVHTLTENMPNNAKNLSRRTIKFGRLEGNCFLPMCYRAASRPLCRCLVGKRAATTVSHTSAGREGTTHGKYSNMIS